MPNQSKPRSLSARILTTSLVITLLALIAAGLLLTWVYRSHIKERFDDSLKAHLYDLIAASELDQSGNLFLNWQPADPRFQSPVSGWYWQAFSGKATKLSSSTVAELDSDPLISTLNNTNGNGRALLEITGPGDVPVRALARKIIPPGAVEACYFVVAGPVSDIDSDVMRFSKKLFATLLILAVGFTVMTALQIRFALNPLKKTRAEIAAIRAGQLDRLREIYPAEIQPVAQEVNELLEHNESLISRARLQAGNLAHAFKNPLTIIQNESRGIGSETIQREVEKLSRSVNRHLNYARIGGTRQHSATRTDVAECLADLVYSMELIYKERTLSIATQCSPDVYFHGDKHDLEEVLGNLLDNACKWADSNVDIVVEQNGEQLKIVITDDGAGIPVTQQGTVFQPGQRLDETSEGDGLGLHIVNDIVDVYGGEIYFDKSAKYGTKINLILPAA